MTHWMSTELSLTCHLPLVCFERELRLGLIKCKSMKAEGVSSIKIRTSTYSAACCGCRAGDKSKKGRAYLPTPPQRPPRRKFLRRPTRYLRGASSLPNKRPPAKSAHEASLLEALVRGRGGKECDPAEMLTFMQATRRLRRRGSATGTPRCAIRRCGLTVHVTWQRPLVTGRQHLAWCGPRSARFGPECAKFGPKLTQHVPNLINILPISKKTGPNSTRLGPSLPRTINSDHFRAIFYRFRPNSNRLSSEFVVESAAQILRLRRALARLRQNVVLNFAANFCRLRWVLARLCPNLVLSFAANF